MSSAVSAGSQPGRFELGSVISVSRGLIKGTKRHVFALSLLIAVANFAIGWFLGGDPFEGKPASVWYHLAVSVMSGVTALTSVTVGLLAAARERVTFSAAFRFVGRLPNVLLVTVPVSLAFTYSQAAFGAGWWMLLCLATVPPLAFWLFYMVDRNMGPLNAMASSITLVMNNLGAYLLFMVLVLVLSVLVGLTLGIAGIWIMPFLMIVPGVMFATAEGLQGDYSA